MAAAPARPAKKVRLDALVQYEPVPLHFKVPHGIFIHEATSVAVDSKVWGAVRRSAKHFRLMLARSCLLPATRAGVSICARGHRDLCGVQSW